MPGTLTRTELEDEVRAGLGNRTDLNTRLVRFLNFAQKDLARSFNWAELMSSSTINFTPVGTPATDKVLTLPDSLTRDIHALIRVSTGGLPIKLVQLPNRQWDQLIGESSELSTGDPSHYRIWGTSVEWWRVPDAAQTIILRRSKWPADLATSSQTSDFENKDHLLILLAMHNGFQSLGMLEDAARTFAVYQRQLIDAKRAQTYQPDLSIKPRGINEDDIVQNDPVIDPFVRRAI